MTRKPTLPPRDQIADDTPLRLGFAAALAYPDGSMTASGLRKEAGRGRLVRSREAQSTGKGSAGAEAEELLRNALATGLVAMKDIQAEAKEAGLSWATVRRAKERLGIVAARESRGRDGGGR